MNAPDLLHIEDGLCYVVFAFDAGSSIRLEEAEHRITAIKERGRIKRQRPAPQYFDYDPPPLRITQDAPVMTIGTFQTLPYLESVLYDFGAIMVIFRLSIRGPFSSLRPLSEQLYDNAVLLEAARNHADQLLKNLGDVVEKAHLSPFVEDYSIFHISKTQPDAPPAQVLDQHRGFIAQILRSEDEPLATQEIEDATASHIVFGQQDLTLIDWNAAMVIGQEMDDVRAVLEFINVELVERRF